MHRYTVLGCVAALIILSCLVPTAFATNDCTPFSDTPVTGMVSIGTIVEFAHYEHNGVVQRTGTIVAYYLADCWPGIPVIGLDNQAYVVDYGEFSADGTRIDIILNRDQFTVIDS